MKFITEITEEQRKQIESINEVTFSPASLRYIVTEMFMLFGGIVLIIFSLWFVLSNKKTITQIKEVEKPNTTIIHNTETFKIMDKVWYYGDNGPINDGVLKQIVTTKDGTYYDVCEWNPNGGDCIDSTGDFTEGYKCLKFSGSFDNCKSKSVIANTKEELLNCKK